MGNIYLGNFVKCTFLVQVEFYKAVAVCALSTHGIAHAFRAFLPPPPSGVRRWVRLVSSDIQIIVTFHNNL